MGAYGYFCLCSPCYAFYNKEVPDHCDFGVGGTSFFEICRM